MRPIPEQVIELVRRVAIDVNPYIRPWVSAEVRGAVRRWLFPPEGVTVYVDVVSLCNLKCPSCPIGNMPTSGSATTRVMDPKVFESIVTKAKRDYGAASINLYNWTEPLIHPQLPELIRIVKRAGLMCVLSSNMNVIKNIDDILRAEPDRFRISLSGFSQDVYEQTHVGGNVERVKRNMRKLSEAKRALGSQGTHVQVYFHKYRHNMHEADAMKAFAQELGFEYSDDWALYMPLEKAMEVATSSLPPHQQEFVTQQYALSPKQAIDVASQFRNQRCLLLEDQLTIDVDGNVALCCATYDPKNNLGNFLELKPGELAARKRNHATCRTCTSHGLHNYFTFSAYPELRERYDALAQRSVALVPAAQTSPEQLVRLRRKQTPPPTS